MRKCMKCGKSTKNEYLCDSCFEIVKQAYIDWVDRGKRVRLGRCVICGRSMESARAFMACSKPCLQALEQVRRKVKNAKNAESRLRKKEENKGKYLRTNFQGSKKKLTNLGVCEREAKAKGLCYGQYMALYRNKNRTAHTKL